MIEQTAQQNTAQPIVDNAQQQGIQQPSQEQQAQQWWSSLPEDLQAVANKFNSLEDMVKGYAFTKSLVGKKFEDFKVEDFQTYSQMMADATGIPQSADGYDIKVKEGGEDGLNACTEDDIKTIKELAHKGGFSKEQAQLLYDALNDIGTNLAQDIQANAQQSYINCMKQLKELWGDNYEYKLQSLDGCLENVLPKLTGFSADDIKEELSNINATSSPILMSVLSSIGELMTEKGSRGYANLSPMDANTRLEQLKADPELDQILTNPRHPRYAEVTGEIQRLAELRDMAV